MKRTGFGIIEGLIAAAAVVVIGALIYFAVVGRSANQTKTASPSPSTTALANTVDDLKSDQAELEKEQDTPVDSSLNDLTSDLNAL